MDLKDLLSQNYCFSVASLELMSTGRVNRNYKLSANDGQAYCLKVYSDAVTDKRLYDGLEVTAYLSPLAFPVPQVVPTASGDLVLHADRLRLLLLRFIPGRNLALDEVGSAEGLGMGAMLGKLHHSLRFFPQADKLHNSLWRGSQESLPRMFDLLAVVQSKEAQDDFDRFVISSLTHRIQVCRGWMSVPGNSSTCGSRLFTEITSSATYCLTTTAPSPACSILTKLVIAFRRGS